MTGVGLNQGVQIDVLLRAQLIQEEVDTLVGNMDRYILGIGISEKAEYQLRIYSKMGEIIFETHDIRQGWDGYFQQDRSAGGGYLWVAEGTWQNGATFNQRGDVTLLWGDRF